MARDVVWQTILACSHAAHLAHFPRCCQGVVPFRYGQKPGRQPRFLSQMRGALGDQLGGKWVCLLDSVHQAMGWITWSLSFKNMFIQLVFLGEELTLIMGYAQCCGSGLSKKVHWFPWGTYFGLRIKMWSGEKLIVEIHARSFHLIIKDEMQTQLQEENMMHSLQDSQYWLSSYICYYENDKPSAKNRGHGIIKIHVTRLFRCSQEKRDEAGEEAPLVLSWPTKHHMNSMKSTSWLEKVKGKIKNVEFFFL